MSSEDIKKHIRTQGKYSDPDLMKNRDKKYKVSPKEKNEKKAPKRYSDERRKSDEHSSVKYEENSTRYSFEKLEEPKKPVEISSPGKHLLSSTEQGESLIYYKPNFFDVEEAWDLFKCFNDTTAWNSKNIVIRGEEYPQPRLVAWYGPYPYTYSGTTLEAAEMPDSVIRVKQKIEAYLNDHGIKVEFNSVLLNLYRDEKDSVAWHSDDELTMGICPTIASISLGEVRRFEIRPKRKYDEENPGDLQPMFMNLCHGSLVVMDGCMQEDWQHRIPKEYHDKGSRINLTFRTVFPFDESSCRPEMGNPKQYAWASNSTKTANSGRAIEFNDEDFPALNSDLKTSGKLSEPSVSWNNGDNNIIHNNNDNKSVGEIVSGDKKSEDDRVDDNASTLPNDDTTENDPSEPRSPSPKPSEAWKLNDRPPVRLLRDQNERNNDSEPHFRQSDYKRNNRYNVARGSIRNMNYDGRTNKPLDREGEDRTWRRDGNEERKDRRNENVKGRYRREENCEGRHRRDENNQGTFRRDENEQGKFRKDENGQGRFRKDENEQGRFRRGENEQGRFRRDENEQGRFRRDENEQGRFRRDENEQGRFRRGENEQGRFRRGENEQGRFKRDEAEQRRYKREENEQGRYRRLENDRFRGNHQNDNARPENFSNLQNEDEKQGRNLQTRDDYRFRERVPQRQNGERNLPPRLSNNERNSSRYRVEEGTHSGESFDNDKHASELVKKEHPRSDHNREHLTYPLNVAATEFVPKLRRPVLPPLKDLLDQDIEVITNQNDSQTYAKSLKSRVLDILDEFEPDDKDYLKFLCEITDGSQSFKNQQLISVRMANIVRKNASKCS